MMVVRKLDRIQKLDFYVVAGDTIQNDLLRRQRQKRRLELMERLNDENPQTFDELFEQLRRETSG